MPSPITFSRILALVFLCGSAPLPAQPVYRCGTLYSDAPCAGAVAIDVAVSNWLFLCTLVFAIFLGFAKRRAELSSLEESATAHRANLADYSLPMLDQMMSISAASTSTRVKPRARMSAGEGDREELIPELVRLLHQLERGPGRGDQGPVGQRHPGRGPGVVVERGHAEQRTESIAGHVDSREVRRR